MASKSILKNWFRTNLKPTQAQFWEWMDSYWHKDELIPQNKVENLIDDMDTKAEAAQFNSHLTDPDAHAEEFEALKTAYHHTTFKPDANSIELVLPELIDAELDCVMFSGLVDMETILLDPVTGTLYNWDFIAGTKYIIFYTKI